MNNILVWNKEAIVRPNKKRRIALGNEILNRVQSIS
jgi:hypothetical protein